MNNVILPEINEQYTIVKYLYNRIKNEYFELYKMILKRSNELFEIITSKIPKIKKIPLFYVYFDDDSFIASFDYFYTEALSDFEDYALNNGHLTSEEFDIIRKELRELYYLSDTLIYYMEIDDDFNTKDLTYFCVSGNKHFESIETLIDCFDE